MCFYIFVVAFTISESKRDQRAKLIISIVKGSKFNIQPYVKMNKYFFLSQNLIVYPGERMSLNWPSNLSITNVVIRNILIFQTLYIFIFTNKITIFISFSSVWHLIRIYINSHRVYLSRHHLRLGTILSNLH